jgi:ankyrin repeat protein
VKVARVFPLALPDSWGSDGLDFKDPDEPPLILAVTRADIDAVQELLLKGADVNARDQWGTTALSRACSHAKTCGVVIKSLFDAGADPNVRTRWGEVPLVSALRTASDGNRTALLREFLEAHADVNAKTGNGMTPLMAAAVTGDADTVRILLEAGADPNASSDGSTALTMARQTGQSQVVKLLEHAGARGR